MITKGIYNKTLNKEDSLSKERLEICRSCKLCRVDKFFGEICSSKRWLNLETNEISKVYKEGFVNGCGCVMELKSRVPEAKCIINKW